MVEIEFKPEWSLSIEPPLTESTARGLPATVLGFRLGEDGWLFRPCFPCLLLNPESPLLQKETPVTAHRECSQDGLILGLRNVVAGQKELEGFGIIWACVRIRLCHFINCVGLGQFPERWECDYSSHDNG